jgi:hypothetical protein
VPFEDPAERDPRAGVTASHPVRAPLIRAAPSVEHPSGAFYRMGQGTTYQRRFARAIAIRRAAFIGGTLLALVAAAVIVFGLIAGRR